MPRNEKELREVQKLRYDYLLRDFDENKNDSSGLDDDGYDEYSESILAIEKKTGRIVGTYRLATLKTLKGQLFKCGRNLTFPRCGPIRTALPKPAGP